MKRFGWLIALLVVAACGGGGGGGGSTPTTNVLIGRILDISNGGRPNPQASVQFGSASVLTSTSDGSFTLSVAADSGTLTIDPRNGGPLFKYDFVVSGATTDLGDLWLGPELVSVAGKIVSAQTGDPVPGAKVAFLGRVATANASGNYSLANVAFSDAASSVFGGIQGLVTAAGFIANGFDASQGTKTGSTVALPDIALTPEGDGTPPPGPVNVWGRVAPADQAAGTQVSVFQGTTLVRMLTVGANATYGFWLTPGTYRLEFVNGALTAPNETVTLNTTSEVIRRDVQLR